MNISKIYRKRIIPAECILLKDDLIVMQDEEVIITKWNTINPKTTFSHGSSCFFLKDGIKVSKIYRSDNSLLYWYCDIVEYSFDPAENAMTFTDLLADVIVDPDGLTKVVDLDELAEAMEKNLITKEQMTSCLRNLNHLLSLIYRDKFDRLQSRLDTLGL
jgi:predicted RNA-binding protein associated with RNAse of E/G family